MLRTLQGHAHETLQALVPAVAQLIETTAYVETLLRSRSRTEHSVKTDLKQALEQQMRLLYDVLGDESCKVINHQTLHLVQAILDFGE